MTDTAETNAGAKPAPVGAAGWTALGVLLVVYLVNFMDRQLFAVLQEQIRADLGLTDWQLGLLGGTMFAVFYATIGLPIAWLADRTHRVRLISGACAVWSLFTILSGAATGFLTMAAARVGVASGEAGGVSPAYAVLSDYFPRSRRGLALGIFTIGAPLGLMAGTILGALIADALSWRWAFVILGLPGFALAAAMLVLVREPERGRLDPPLPAHMTKPRPFDAARAVLKTPTLLLLTAAAAATSFGGYGLYQWIPSFLQRSQGLALESVGALLGPIFLVGVLGAVGGGWIADRLGRTHVSAYAYVPAASLALAAPCFLIAILARDAQTTIALLIFPVALSYAWLGPGLAAVQTLTSSHLRASTAAIVGFFNNLIGFGLGPLCVGALSHLLQAHMGEGEALRIAMAAAAMSLLVAAALFFAAGLTLKRDLERLGQA
jgi:predicted MFS family arabinose efflux permease